MDTQNRNSVQSPDESHAAPAPSRRDGLLTLMVSVVAFSTIGAWLGSKLGRLGDKKNNHQATRILSWGGAATGGLLAWAAQPQPTATTLGTNDAAQIPAVQEKITEPLHRMDAGPRVQVAVETAQTDGLLAPAAQQARA